MHQSLHEYILGLRIAEVEALNDIRLALVPEEQVRRLLLHALNADLHSYAMAKHYGIFHQIAVEIALEDILHKHPVNLDYIAGKVFQETKG